MLRFLRIELRRFFLPPDCPVRTFGLFADVTLEFLELELVLGDASAGGALEAAEGGISDVL